MKLLKGNSGDSILLAVVKAFSTVSGILSTMIVSHALSLELYGTYSQAALIVTTATNLTALGLVDAANYYFNRSVSVEEQKQFVNTIIGLQCIVGLVTGIFLLLLANGIAVYFDNRLLKGLFGWIAFRPLFANINVSLQHLQVSIGRAKAAAARNGLFAALRLLAFAAAAYIVKDITVILVTFLAFEIVITVYFSLTFARERFWIRPYRINWSSVREILAYSIPMGIYVLTNSLSRDIDKIFIGGWYSTDRYAVYANCATLLPFDIISSAFLVVLIPILTRYFGTGKYDGGQRLFKNYLKIGYYTSFTFTIACMILSKEMILFLYGEKYLSGQFIFLLYTIVDMVKFANMSIVLSACGRTKSLMISSLLALGGNAILNVICYRLFGFAGPAIATVLVTLCLTATLATMSARSLHTTVTALMDWKDFFLFLCELIVLGIPAFAARALLDGRHVHYLAIIGIVGCLYIGSVLLMQKGNIVRAMKEINALH